MPRADIYDLTIIGAGFAGLRCASAAATRGLRVLVLDRKGEAGAPLHTTGIFVQEAADELDFPARYSRAIPGVRLFAPNGGSIDLASPGYAFHATDTPGLLNWMAEETIRTGAHIRFGATFKGATPVMGGYDLDGLGLQTRFLVGADGARSQVARSLNLPTNRHLLRGIEVGIEPDPCVDPGFLHCFLGRKIAPGYIAWAVPGPRHIQLGLAVSPGQTPDLAGALRRMTNRLGIVRPRIVDRRAGLIPCGGRLSCLGGARSLLIGDAAGLVSPLTAGGILPALQSGRQAGIAIARYLNDKGPSPAAHLARTLPRFRAKRMQRILMDQALPDTVWNVALTTPPMRALARKVYFHRRAPGPRLVKEGLDLLSGGEDLVH